MLPKLCISFTLLLFAFRVCAQDYADTGRHKIIDINNNKGGSFFRERDSHYGKVFAADSERFVFKSSTSSFLFLLHLDDQLKKTVRREKKIEFFKSELGFAVENSVFLSKRSGPGINQPYKSDTIRDLQLRNTVSDGAFTINNLTANGIGIYECYFPSLYINRVNTNLDAEKISVGRVFALSDFKGNLRVEELVSKTDTLYLGISHSSLSISRLSGLKGKFRELNFMQDTFHTAVDLAQFELNRSSHPVEGNGIGADPGAKSLTLINFYGCIFDCPIVLTQPGDYCMVKFYDCTFKKGASIVNVNATDLEFISCINFGEPLRIEADRMTSRPVSLVMNNTRVSNFDFLYTGNMVLSSVDKPYSAMFGNSHPRYGNDDADSLLSKELSIANYEYLVSKYKREGSEASYQRIFKEYKNFKASDSRVLRTWNFIQWFIWDYGFSIGRLFGTMGGFLLLFFILNIVFRRDLRIVNSIIPLDRKATSTRERILNGFRKYIRIFVFTCYVFFSLKIDFESISQRRTTLILLYFTQYIVGLGYLFLIFNYVLKAS